MYICNIALESEKKHKQINKGIITSLVLSIPPWTAVLSQSLSVGDTVAVLGRVVFYWLVPVRLVQNENSWEMIDTRRDAQVQFSSFVVQCETTDNAVETKKRNDMRVQTES